MNIKKVNTKNLESEILYNCYFDNTLMCEFDEFINKVKDTLKANLKDIRYCSLDSYNCKFNYNITFTHSMLNKYIFNCIVIHYAKDNEFTVEVTMWD